MQTDKKQIIFFDFDGVIVDSFDVALAVAKLACPDLMVEEYKKRFTGNIFEESYLGHSDKCNHNLDFYGHYNPLLGEKVGLFSGIDTVVKELSQKNILIVISSSEVPAIKRSLERHNLLECFEDILGSDTHKSKSEKIKMVLAKYEVSPEKCFFVTDTIGDLEEASKVGVPTIGVTWGFHSKETLQDKRFIAVFSTPEELRSFFVR